MSNTDFIDDDLIQRRDAVKEVKMGPSRQEASPGDVPRMDSVPTSDLNLTPLTTRREEINSKVATVMDELERLRAKQSAIEREKSNLEHLRNNQEKYEAGKREMIDHLEKSLVALEREQVVLNQRLALLAETEKRFKELLAEMRSFNEEQWPSVSEELREELGKALVIIENARKEYNQSHARIEAMRESHAIGAIAQPMLPEEALGPDRFPRTFFDWIKVGLAVSLPVMVVIVVLIAVLLVKRY